MRLSFWNREAMTISAPWIILFNIGAMASGRLNMDRLVTHTISPGELGTAYEGLLKNKEEYLGVVVRWT